MAKRAVKQVSNPPPRGKTTVKNAARKTAAKPAGKKTTRKTTGTK
jgi:hypothetical protein